LCGAHDLPDKKTVELVPAGAVFGDLVGLSGEDLVDRGRDLTLIRHLAQALSLDDRINRIGR
jgi:hypothetical protein